MKSKEFIHFYHKHVSQMIDLIKQKNNRIANLEISRLNLQKQLVCENL